MKTDTSNSKLYFNFLVLGDSKIGKTSILEQYVNKSFKENYIVTIGIDKRFKYLNVNNVDIYLNIIDTAGQERFRSISKMSYNRADGILVGFDLNDPKTLESVNYWIEQIYINNGKNSKISLVLFGNKCDIKSNNLLKEKDINEIIEKYNLKYFETSAKLNINIQDLFEYLVKDTIIKKGLLKTLGLKENSTIDDIIVREKENQRPSFNFKKSSRRSKKKKKKSFC